MILQKTSIYTLILFICFPLLLTSQSSYLKRFNNDEHQREWVHNVFKTDSNTLSIITNRGLTRDSEKPVFLSIRNIDLENGAQKWQSINSNSGTKRFFYNRTILHDNSYISTGSVDEREQRRTSLISRKLTGEVNWIKEYGFFDTINTGLDIAITQNNLIAVCGGYSHETVQQTLVSLYDEQGNELWNRIIFGSLSEMEGRAIESDEVNNLYVLSEDAVFIPSLQQAAITKFTIDGDSLWTKYYPINNRCNPADIIKSADGNLVFSAGVRYDFLDNLSVPTLVKVSTDGDLLWSRDYFWELNGGGFGERLIKTNEDGFAMCVNVNGYPCLIVTDPDGEPVLVKHFDSLGIRSPKDLLQLKDGSFIIVGQIPSSFFPTEPEDYETFWLLKTDVEGNIVSLVSDKFDKTSIKIYPNPTTDNIQIEVPFEILNKNTKIKVVDISGAVRMERLLESNQTLDVSKLATGVYFVNTFNGNNLIGVSKFIKK